MSLQAALLHIKSKQSKRRQQRSVGRCVSKLLVWCHPSVLKASRSHLTPRGDTNAVFLTLERITVVKIILSVLQVTISNFRYIGTWRFFSYVTLVNHINEILYWMPQCFIHFFFLMAIILQGNCTKDHQVTLEILFLSIYLSIYLDM